MVGVCRVICFAEKLINFPDLKNSSSLAGRAFTVVGAMLMKHWWCFEKKANVGNCYQHRLVPGVYYSSNTGCNFGRIILLETIIPPEIRSWIKIVNWYECCCYWRQCWCPSWSLVWKRNRTYPIWQWKYTFSSTNSSLLLFSCIILEVHQVMLYSDGGPEVPDWDWRGPNFLSLWLFSRAGH